MSILPLKVLVASLPIILAAALGLSAQEGSASIALKAVPRFSGLSLPVLVRSAKDGTGRFFIVQQRGRIMVAEAGSASQSVFLDLTSKVSQTGSERGLLGLAFHPQFSSNGYFFVNYTRTNADSTTTTVIARYRTVNSNSSGDPSSERVLLTIAQPYSNHNGGMVEFGPDGYLYLGMGDGGSANDPQGNAQNKNSLLGKMLRIAPDVSGDAAAQPYTVPADNPFVGTEGADEIYAMGLRNPWRWSFDRGGTRQLWAADVGQNLIEEVDVITLGGNYGWRVYEGNSCTGLDAASCIPSDFAPPVFQYDRTSPRCAVTGGYVYRGKRQTFPQGAYLYADYCSGEVMMWHRGSQTVVIDTSRMISSFGEDDEGELYIVGLGSASSATGTVEKLVRPARSRLRSAYGATSADRQRAESPSSSRNPLADWIDLEADRARSSDKRPSEDEVAVSGDIDGDGVPDVGTFNRADGMWSWRLGAGSGIKVFQLGAAGDQPAVLDFDMDGKVDLAVFRPSIGIWFVMRSSDGAVELRDGTPGRILRR